MRAGRDCPLDYRLAPDCFSVQADLHCETLYVVGGLYGNRQALAALNKRLTAEPEARVVFNGDAHWFDRDPTLFDEIERELSHHLLLRGNVETELGRPETDGAGCGCAYPDEVDDRVVDWSNSIHAQLQQTVSAMPGVGERLRARPPTAVVEIAGHRISITHGDETSLAGWRCARDALAMPARQAELAAWARRNEIAVLATSHTCAPAAWADGDFAVINNGAAGMPNFNNGRYGLVTRISTTPHPSALYRASVNGLVVEAIPLNYRHDDFIRDFDRQWPAGSPAAQSYRNRLLKGTTDEPSDALLGGFSLGQTLCETATLD